MSGNSPSQSFTFPPAVARRECFSDQKPKRFVFVVESNGFTPQQAAPVDYERKSRHQRPLGMPAPGLKDFDQHGPLEEKVTGTKFDKSGDSG